MYQPPTLIEPSGMALRLAAVRSPCRTPGAVKARARNGSLAPDFRTERGVILWTEQSAEREVRSELIRLAIADDLKRKGYSPRQIAAMLFPRLPKQLELCA